MSSPRKEVGFVGSLGKMTFLQFLWPEGVIALFVGVGGGSCVVRWGSVTEQSAVINEGLAIVGVLLGIVFAAFSLLFALSSDDYLRLLSKVEGGIVTFTQPFILALGFQIITIFFAIGYNASVGHVTSKISSGVFVFWCFLFSYVLVDVLALARNVALHGIYRARLAVSSQAADTSNGKVTAIDSRNKETK